jgi:hypothetical protein
MNNFSFLDEIVDSPLNNFNFVPNTVDGNQFLAYKQSGAYMTDYRPSSDMYSFLVNKANSDGVMTGNQLRQYLQDNAESFIGDFMLTTGNQFINMKIPGASNTCSTPYENTNESIIYSGGAQLVNNSNQVQKFAKDCPLPGEMCVARWNNTPLPQQGRYCANN